MRKRLHTAALRDERGATVVEFAFIVPLLIVLVLGIAEFGHAFQVSGTLSAAAREGVRVMALQNDRAAAIDAARKAAPGLNPALTVGEITVPTTCPPPGPGAQTATVQLTIDYPMPFLTGFFGSSITLHGTGVMRCNG
jgi:Flp pilus assembly protein TadG